MDHGSILHFFAINLGTFGENDTDLRVDHKWTRALLTVPTMMVPVVAETQTIPVEDMTTMTPNGVPFTSNPTHESIDEHFKTRRRTKEMARSPRPLPELTVTERAAETHQKG